MSARWSSTPPGRPQHGDGARTDKQAQARHEKERRKAEAAANAATVEAVAPAADEEE